jgi:hypothetical protein
MTASLNGPPLFATVTKFKQKLTCTFSEDQPRWNAPHLSVACFLQQSTFFTTSLLSIIDLNLIIHHGLRVPAAACCTISRPQGLRQANSPSPLADLSRSPIASWHAGLHMSFCLLTSSAGPSRPQLPRHGVSDWPQSSAMLHPPSIMSSIHSLGHTGSKHAVQLPNPPSTANFFLHPRTRYEEHQHCHRSTKKVPGRQ